MKVPAKKRCLGAVAISFKKDLSFKINANSAIQKAIKKAKADAATGEFRCFPNEAFIAAKIGIPIPAKSMIEAYDSIFPPAVISVFFFIIFINFIFICNNSIIIKYGDFIIVYDINIMLVKKFIM